MFVSKTTLCQTPGLVQNKPFLFVAQRATTLILLLVFFSSAAPAQVQQTQAAQQQSEPQSQQGPNSNSQEQQAPQPQQPQPPAQPPQPQPQQTEPESSSSPGRPEPILPPAMTEEVVQNPNAPCVQPPPPVTWQDYQGPLAKTVALFADRLERKSVGPPVHRHYKPGVLLCTLELRDRLWLFVRDSTDPVAFLSAAWNAGQSQVEDTPQDFGRGFTGYLDRFGANMAGQSSAGFFKDFAYPTIFEEDSRYYRLGRGSIHRRIFHGMSHVVIAHNENGNRMFNFSEWLGDATVRVLANTYLPGSRRGVAPVAESMGQTMAWNSGYDVLREFWPEIAKKFHLPFREENESTNTPSIPN